MKWIIGLVALGLTLAGCSAFEEGFRAGYTGQPLPSHALLTPGAASTSAATLPPGYVPGDAVLIVGQDIAPGVYRTAGPPDDDTTPYCYWARLKGFGGSLDEVITSGVSHAHRSPAIVEVKPSDVGFKTSSCQPWQKIK